MRRVPHAAAVLPIHLRSSLLDISGDSSTKEDGCLRTVDSVQTMLRQSLRYRRRKVRIVRRRREWVGLTLGMAQAQNHRDLCLR